MSGQQQRALARQLAMHRQRAFVGRIGERELFAAALAERERSCMILFLHGPGGVGKSALVDVLAGLADAAGSRVRRVDGGRLGPTPAAMQHELTDAISGADLDRGERGDRLVVLIDGYEQLRPVDDWVRTALLPLLPATSLAVLAGRAPPSVAWRSDSGWRPLLRIVALRNLPPDDSRRYLRTRGVDPSVHDRLAELSHGHPLALSLLADLALSGGDVALDPSTSGVVAALVRRFVDVVPTAAHRRALEACALARVTTESLLREVAEVDDAGALFEWLGDLSFVERHADGLAPHDLARDVLDVDLRWRDPDAYRDGFRRVRAHVHRRLHDLDGIEQQRAIFDEKFVFRNLPSVLSPVDWEAWGQSFPEPATAADREAILEMVAASEGAASAEIAERWWDRQRAAFSVVRVEGVVEGFLALLTPPDDEDLSFDPGAAAARDHAQRTSPPRHGEVITQTRFVIDRLRYQAPSATLNAAPILTMQRYLRRRTWPGTSSPSPTPIPSTSTSPSPICPG